MLSPYAANLQQQLGINKDVCEKLVPNLQDKTNYVVDIRNLKFYRDPQIDHQASTRSDHFQTGALDTILDAVDRILVTSSRSTARLNPCISTPNCWNVHLTLLKLEILRRINVVFNLSRRSTLPHHPPMKSYRSAGWRRRP